ncbi:MAG TPA: hypothetical protein VGE52_14935 [Pirellulales bacterium]
MKRHFFTIYVEGAPLDLNDALIDALVQSGCTARRIAIQGRRLRLDFDEEADSIDAAVQEAIDHVEPAWKGCRVAKVVRHLWVRDFQGDAEGQSITFAEIERWEYRRRADGSWTSVLLGRFFETCDTGCPISPSPRSGRPGEWRFALVQDQKRFVAVTDVRETAAATTPS